MSIDQRESACVDGHTGASDLEQLVRDVVAETGADRRSVVKRLAGLDVRGAAGRAIDRAIAARAQESTRKSA